MCIIAYKHIELMKKLLIILTLVLGIGLNANSQNFGFKGGINFSHAKDSDFGTGFTVGGLVNKPLNKVFYLNSELLFTNYSYYFKNNLTDPAGNKLNNYTQFSFNKIELPITIIAQSKKGIVKPFAAIGISTGVNISGKFKQDAYDIIPESKGSLTNLNTLNISMPVSIGFEVKEHSVIELRYNIGLTNQYNNSDVKVNSIYLTFGYKF